ncbi:MAG: AAA family ATPase [Phycisphaeraceae bacterium]|nr:AAA family ATPase [Phycisphaeraceae bacterium]
MDSTLKSLSIHGFKSIDHLEGLALDRRLNILIGANGAGKSNFVEFFRMLRAMMDGVFQKFINASGGGDEFFYLGPRVTRRIKSHLEFPQNIYEFDLEPTADGRIQIAEERVRHTGGEGLGTLNTVGAGSLESAVRKNKDEPGLPGNQHGVEWYVYNAISSWTVYHFHDTSDVAPMRRPQSLRDNERFREDASNLAPFLLRLRETDSGRYQLIRDTIRLIAPFFNDFVLRPEKRGENELIRLEWTQKGSDFPFQPSQLSDGTIRFICLATALMQPRLPATILIDEPELGLHPYALSVLAELIKSASERTQVIISTQSSTLLDYFDPEQVIVVNRREGRSTFERLSADQLKEWLDEYSVGELWQKNVVAGGPMHE